MKHGIGHAHGKLILIGEHAVVYRQPAIALPFSTVSVTTTITPSDQMTVDCIYHNGLLSEAPGELANLQAVVAACLDFLGRTGDCFHIKIDSSIPQERGMGSSAAVANATVQAIFAYFDTDLSGTLRFDLAQLSETIAHGSPSGLDAKVTVSDRPLYFIKNTETTAFDVKAQAYLVIGDSGESGQTKLAVASLREKKEANPSRINHLIQKLGVLTNQIRQNLATNNLHEMGHGMNLAQDYLAEMGVSNASLDRLVKAANRAGALGAKLTGGGWGGCMIALSQNLETARQVREALADSQASQTWMLAL